MKAKLQASESWRLAYMNDDLRTKRATFRALHEQGCFVLANPWDVGGIRRLEKLGFKALASTSAGAAWALGHKDGELSLDEVLEHLRLLCTATNLPVNADFEAGFADEPEGVATNVALALDTGVAGLSVEDRTGQVLLVGRSEGYLIGRTELAETIDRLVAYAEAGADCLYAPGITDLSAIRTLVSAVAPKPVNVLLIGPNMRVADLADAGVRRVSVGGSLAAAAWAAFDRAVRLLIDEGTLPKRE
jgi:2-methylisocitrate lyase-like PEP mutase family enzyme